MNTQQETFCWHCGNRLHHVDGKKGFVQFLLVKDRRSGNPPYRVHGDCYVQLRDERGFTLAGNGEAAT